MTEHDRTASRVSARRYPGSVTAYLASEILRIEAQALLTAADRLDEESFGAGIELLVKAPGAVVCVGAGTSGIVARKIAATLTSTGTRAVFLHPADALHGGLGVISTGDVVIAVSNSGETDEILGMLPYLRTRSVRLIAIVGNRDSSLAAAAEVVLHAAVEAEACPLDLAPTSSSTVAIAVGDALAIGAMRKMGLTPEGFARNHPSGRLGRRLTLEVRHLMRPLAAIGHVEPTTEWWNVLSAISAGGVGSVLVLDQDGGLAGLITDGDVRRAMQDPEAVVRGGMTAKEMMTVAPTVVDGGTLAYDALRLMEDRPSQISVLPVSENGRPAGVVRLHDLVRAGL